MLTSLLRWAAGRCDVHDRASPSRIAALEEELGIDPEALTRHRRSARDIVEAFANPDLIDCGRPRCRKRS